MSRIDIALHGMPSLCSASLKHVGRHFSGSLKQDGLAGGFIGGQDPGNHNRICSANQPDVDGLPGAPAAGLCQVSDFEIRSLRLYADNYLLVILRRPRINPEHVVVDAQRIDRGAVQRSECQRRPAFYGAIRVEIAVVADDVALNAADAKALQLPAPIPAMPAFRTVLRKDPSDWDLRVPRAPSLPATCHLNQ